MFVVVYMCEAAAGLRAGAQPAAGSISGRRRAEETRQKKRVYLYEI